MPRIRHIGQTRITSTKRIMTSSSQYSWGPLTTISVDIFLVSRCWFSFQLVKKLTRPRPCNFANWNLGEASTHLRLDHAATNQRKSRGKQHPPYEGDEHGLKQTHVVELPENERNGKRAEP